MPVYAAHSWSPEPSDSEMRNAGSRLSKFLAWDLAADLNEQDLIVYLRSGDIWRDYPFYRYVQAPCSYITYVLDKVSVHFSRIYILTDLRMKIGIHPCLLSLSQRYRNASIVSRKHGADHILLAKAHNVVLTGVSTFGETGLMLNRRLKNLYIPCWSGDTNEKRGIWCAVGTAWRRRWKQNDNFRALQGIFSIHRFFVHNITTWWTHELQQDIVNNCTGQCGLRWPIETMKEQYAVFQSFTTVLPYHQFRHFRGYRNMSDEYCIVLTNQVFELASPFTAYIETPGKSGTLEVIQASSINIFRSSHFIWQLSDYNLRGAFSNLVLYQFPDDEALIFWSMKRKLFATVPTSLITHIQWDNFSNYHFRALKTRSVTLDERHCFITFSTCYLTGNDIFH